MNGSDLRRRRLHNQRLWGPPCASAEDVVGRMAAMQAQEFAYAKWSVAQRARDVDLAAVDRAFADGVILRTHLLRPTWHFVRAADVRWMLVISAPRVHALNAYYNRQLELDAAIFKKCRQVLARALRDGHLERDRLAAALGRAGITARGHRLASILMHAEQEAVVISGALRGKQHTYALFDERVPSAKTLAPEDALSELTRRYFESRGPATVKDYAVWASLPIGIARRGVESVGSSLRQETVDGRTYWLTDGAARRSPTSPRVDLVQMYDEYVMGYSESRDVIAPAKNSIGARGTLPFYHPILVDGHVAGHWRHTLGKTGVVLDKYLYRKLDRREARALDAAVSRYSEFVGLPARLR